MTGHAASELCERATRTERGGEAGASEASLSEQPEGTAAKRRLRAPINGEVPKWS